MTNKYYYYLIIPILAFVIVVGLGLYYKDKIVSPNSDSAMGQNQNQDLPYLYPEEDASVAELSDKDKLLAGIEKFRSAQSLRLKLLQKTSEGDVNGELDYIRPLRLRASFSMPGSEMLDTIIVGGTVYVKINEDVWEMTDNAFLKQFSQDFFTSMLTTEATLESFAVSADATISVEANRAKKCTNYNTKYNTDEGQYDMSFCLNDKGEIQVITKQTKDGEIIMEYSDYNVLFHIERPVLPLLAPTFPTQ
ncbi:hypothetical protein KKG46_02440 [Patescibacteria group bacterium]|nr:hypothetical protein [Patescibacteria group bacterium]